MPETEKLPQQKMVDISTAHIPAHTAQALGHDAEYPSRADLFNKLVYTHWSNYGWIICCTCDNPEDTMNEHPELAKLMSLCIEQGVEFLKLDCDAEKIKGLPTFEW